MMSGLCCLLEAGESGIGERPLTGLDLCEPCHQFWTVKLPLQRCRAVMRPLCVHGQAEPYRCHAGKVIRGQHLALDKRAGDCDLLEPTGVDGCLDQHETRSDLTQPCLRGGTAMRRAVVDTPA